SSDALLQFLAPALETIEAGAVLLFLDPDFQFVRSSRQFRPALLRRRVGQGAFQFGKVRAETIADAEILGLQAESVVPNQIEFPPRQFRVLDALAEQDLTFPEDVGEFPRPLALPGDLRLDSRQPKCRPPDQETC